MNKETKRRLNMCERAEQFCGQLTMAPSGTSLVEELGATIALIKDLGRDQVSGRGTVSVGAEARVQTKEELREVMLLIVSVAKRLNPADFPRVAEQFQMPRSSGYQPLLDTARAFVRDMTPIKAEFVNRLTLPIVDLLPALITQFETGTVRKHTGLNGQVSSTAGLNAAGLLGVKIVRELDPIVKVQIRGNEALLVAWKSASHVERDARRRKVEGLAGKVEGPRSKVEGLGVEVEGLASKDEGLAVEAAA